MEKLIGGQINPGLNLFQNLREWNLLKKILDDSVIPFIFTKLKDVHLRLDIFIYIGNCNIGRILLPLWSANYLSKKEIEIKQKIDMQKESELRYMYFPITSIQINIPFRSILDLDNLSCIWVLISNYPEL